MWKRASKVFPTAGRRPALPGLLMLTCPPWAPVEGVQFESCTLGFQPRCVHARPTASVCKERTLPALRKIVMVLRAINQDVTIAKVQNVFTQIAQLQLGDFAMCLLICIDTPVKERSSDCKAGQ